MIDLWHLGDAPDFVDWPQQEHWERAMMALGHGDPMAVLDFLMDQHGKPILPGLRRLIERLHAGEVFPREDGWPLRLEPPSFHRPRGHEPMLGRYEKIWRAALFAYEAMQNGVGKDAAKKQARDAHGVTLAEIGPMLEQILEVEPSIKPKS